MFIEIYVAVQQGQVFHQRVLEEAGQARRGGRAGHGRRWRRRR